jgi:hypothetical protein
MEAARTTSQLFFSLLPSGHYVKADQVLSFDTHVSKEANPKYQWLIDHYLKVLME